MTNLVSSSVTSPPVTLSKHNMTQLTDSMSSEKEDTQDLALKHKNNNNVSDCYDINQMSKEKENTETLINTSKHYKNLNLVLANGEGKEDERTTSTRNSDIKQDVIPSTPASWEKHNYITSSTPFQATHSPSTSPKSEKSPSPHRSRTPSFSGTPPHPAFSPPGVITPGFERFNKSVAMGGMGPLTGGHTALKQMDSLMNRNCSDLMRSLAAKYNNTNPNEFFSNPHNGHLPHQGLGGFKPRGPSPFLSLPPSISITPSHSATAVNQDKNTKSQVALPSAGSLTGFHPHQGAPASHMFPPMPGMLPGFPGLPMVDVSSTQVLMNMMRNASVSASQQAQLDNYLRGASKRPSDGTTTPLDLSSSMPNKRLRTESPKSVDHKNGHTIPYRIDKSVEISRSNSNTSPDTSRVTSTTLKSLPTLCSDKRCPSVESISHWTVQDVINFVASIELCEEYSEAFRENKIDGSSLPLLTEEHLTSSMNMKLGPAIKLRLVLARKLGACNVCLHCNHCHVLPEERTSTIA